MEQLLIYEPWGQLQKIKAEEASPSPSVEMVKRKAQFDNLTERKKDAN